MLLRVYILLFPIYFSVIGSCIRRSTHDVIIPANVSKGVCTREDSINPRYSRIELVLGSQGVDQLNQSRVLIIGANDLALKVITHLVRSGIGSIDIYDTDAKVCNELIQKVKILHSNANIRLMIDFDRDYDFVICSNAKLQSAIDLNKKLRRRSKFICAHSKGVYGLIISDFGEKHLITRESDYQYPEHSCKLIETGIFITCLELKIDGNTDMLYKRGDRIQITYPNYLLKHGQSSINVKNCTIMNVRVDGNKLLLYINLNTKKWPEMTMSIKKIDKERYMRFDEIGRIVENILGYGSVLNKIRDILFKTTITKDDILIISRDEVNVKEIVKEFFNDLSSGRDSYLTSLNIPATTTLIGALVAQEVIKGITNLYTPSKLIVVDRSDVFKDLNGNVVDVEIANEIVKKVSDYSYLLVGAGALGCDYLQLFAEMNIKNVLVVDNDVVELSNLSRQCLFTERDIGKFKAKTAIENLKTLYGKEFKNYKALNREFDENNNFNPSVTVSAVDNLLTRIQLDNYSIEHNTHFIEAGIHGMQCK